MQYMLRAKLAYFGVSLYFAQSPVFLWWYSGISTSLCYGLEYKRDPYTGNGIIRCSQWTWLRSRTCNERRNGFAGTHLTNVRRSDIIYTLAILFLVIIPKEKNIEIEREAISLSPNDKRIRLYLWIGLLLSFALNIVQVTIGFFVQDSIGYSTQQATQLIGTGLAISGIMVVLSQIWELASALHCLATVQVLQWRFEITSKEALLPLLRPCKGADHS